MTDDPYDISTHAAVSTGVLVVPVSVDGIVRVVEDFSQAIQQPRLVSLSAAGAEFNRPLSIRTWGLRITLKFRPLHADQTLIWARCQPKLRTTIWDGGQGETDLRIVLGGIDQWISSDGHDLYTD